MDVFPYRYRPGQRELVGFIDGSVRDGMCPVIEAGTGTGKTITSLVGAIPIAREKDLKIVYLTRTKSQQLQVIRECGHIEGTVCAALQGRTAQSCPMMRGDADLRTGTPEEISKLCSEYKRRTENGCVCPYFANLEGISVEHWLDVLRGNPEPEAFADVCEKAMICPYELMKHLLPYADVVAASYPFVFAPQILSRFEEWIGTPLERMLIIVDEAHNLPDYLRDIQTYEYSRYSMEMAEKEARKEGDHEIHDGLRITDLASVLREVLDAAAREYLIDEDGIIPLHFVEEELMSRLGATSVALGRMAKGLQDMGDIIEEKLKQKRKLPRSYIGSMGRFLELWMTERDEYGVRLVIGGDNPRFQAYCMDPAPAAEPLNASFSSILMSGTLEPLEDFAKEIGLERPAVRRLGSVFPPDNLLTLYTDRVSMRYEDRRLEENYRLLTDMLIDTVNSVRVNTAVFFPSYDFMDLMTDDGLVDRLGRDVFFERRGMPQGELMENVLKLAGKIAKNAPIAVRHCKKAINDGISLPIEKAVEVEEKLFGDCFETHDQKEGMACFLSREKPKPKAVFTNN